MRLPFKASRYLLFFISLFMLFSCKKNEVANNITTTAKDRLKSVVLGDTSYMHVSETKQLTLTLSPSNYPLDSIKLHSSDTTVLTVTNAGLLTAKKAGISTITASNLVNSISTSAKMTVVPDSLSINLLGYYPFNNNAMDMSGNGNNGIIDQVIPTTDRNGNANSAYYFDLGFTLDTSSFIVIKDNPSLRLSNTDFTINTWIETVDFGNTEVVIKKIGQNSTNGWNLSVGSINNISGYTFYSVLESTHTPTFVSKNVISKNQWHMISVTYSIAKMQATIYLDGVYDSSLSNVPSPSANNYANIYIGATAPLLFIGYPFTGKIDDIRIYNRMLSQGEIKELFNSSD